MPKTIAAFAVNFSELASGLKDKENFLKSNIKLMSFIAQQLYKENSITEVKIYDTSPLHPNNNAQYAQYIEKYLQERSPHITIEYVSLPIVACFQKVQDQLLAESPQFASSLDVRGIRKIKQISLQSVNDKSLFTLLYLYLQNTVENFTLGDKSFFYWIDGGEPCSGKLISLLNEYNKLIPQQTLLFHARLDQFQTPVVTKSVKGDGAIESPNDFVHLCRKFLKLTLNNFETETLTINPSQISIHSINYSNFIDLRKRSSSLPEVVAPPDRVKTPSLTDVDTAALYESGAETHTTSPSCTLT